MPNKLIYESKNSKILLLEDSEWGMPVILKILNQEYPSNLTVDHFYNEFEILEQINIQGIRKVYKREKIKNRHSIYMEYIKGHTLRKLLNDNYGDLELFLRVGISICNILENIHNRNIVHKDICPENILVVPETHQLYLIDFGISSNVELKNQDPDYMNNPEGTIAYISPEQTGRMNRVVDYRTDLYSLGAVFYEMLTGHPPFLANDPMEMVHFHIAQIPEPVDSVNSHVPVILSKIIAKLLEKNAEDRYQSAQGIKRDLEECQRRLINGKIDIFPIAKNDFSEKFHILQKLFGRQREIEILTNAFNQVSEGSRKLVLVAGYSGTGKSTLVHEMHQPITKKRGYFINGKFDQFQRVIPLYAILQALKEFTNILLSENEKILHGFKKNIMEAIGSEGKVLTDVLPNLEYVIGIQPPVPVLGDTESQNRFNYLFRKFIKIIATKEHPLVLFIDDLQWADLSSLNLMEAILSDTNIQHLLCIFAYRDNEVTSSHPFMHTVERLIGSKVDIEHIEVSNLSTEHVHSLITESLRDDPLRTKDLSDLVYMKTNGNAFFVKQFLLSIYQQGFLYFDSGSHRMTWNSTSIKTLKITDNVIDLLTSKILKLTAITQQALMQASCIGNRFDIHTLSIVIKGVDDETKRILHEALFEGIIIPIAEDFKFAHDKIHQAVHSLIPEKERDKIHLQIGRLLLENIPAKERDQRLFDIVNQLNWGKDLITDESEHTALAELNLQAGQKAKASAAFLPALQYFETGIMLLKRDHWKSQYNLSLELYSQAAEAAYTIADFTVMEKYTNLVIKNVNDPLDAFSAYETKILSNIAQNNLREALDIGLEAIRGFKIVFPSKPSKLTALWSLVKTKVALRGLRIENLGRLPAMNNRKYRNCIKILAEISPPAYWASPNLLLLVIFKMVRYSVKNGNSPESYFTYAAYGMILCELGEINNGYRFGRTAIQLLNKPDTRAISCKTIFPYYCFVIHWKEHLRNAISPFLTNYHLGLETGDVDFACLSYYFYCQHEYYAGERLSKVCDDMSHAVESISPLKQETCLNFLNIHYQAALNFSGKSDDPLVLKGNAYDETKMLDKHIEVNDKTALYKYYFQKLILNYMLGQYNAAITYADKAKQNIDGVTAQYCKGLFFLYDSLALFEASVESSQTLKKKYLKRISKNINKIEKWSRFCPDNYRHKFYLLQAEYLQWIGKPKEAIDKYELSIKFSRKSGYIQEEGLANELAGRFYIHMQQDSLAEFYLKNAFQCYRDWGAEAKLNQMGELYPQYLSGIAKTISTEVGPSSQSIIHDTTLRTTNPELDLITVLKASVAISSEIVLDNLLKVLMKVVAENLGAQNGYLLLKEKDELNLKTKIDAVNGTVVVQEIYLTDKKDIPHSIINYVSRTKEYIVIGNATQDETFSRDPYILVFRPKSIFCMPIINQGKLIGILYFENNLVVNAFTRDRIELLHLLSGQIAISIDNALMYEKMEQIVQERTAQLEEEKKKTDNLLLNMLPNETAEELKNKGKATPKRMENVTVMFADFKDFTKLSERMSAEELVREIDFYFSEFDKIVGECGVEKIKTIGDAYMCVGGLPVSNSTHASDTIKAAIKFMGFIEKIKSERLNTSKPFFEVRIGIHSGPVVAGIVGTKKFAYDIWGDTVNTAARMTTSDEVGRINISGTTFNLIKDQYNCVYRGRIAAKNKGEIEMYFIE